MNERVIEFANADAFRSATVAELVNHGDPFRRPVRPEDLPHLDFAVDLAEDRLLSLSSLLGNRILLNSYESEMLFLPSASDAGRRPKYLDFYSAANLASAKAVRPALERHLFGSVSAVDEESNETADPAGTLRALATETHQAELAMARQLASLPNHEATDRFLLMQASCGWQARASAIQTALRGDWRYAAPVLADWGGRCLLVLDAHNEVIGELLDRHGLLRDARAYWQFYLTSSLARLNNLYRLAFDHTCLSEFVGAALYEMTAWTSFLESFDTSTEGALAAAREYTEDALGAVGVATDEMAGYLGVAAVSNRLVTGASVARRIAELANQDILAQVRWAGDPGGYSSLARLLQDEIDDGTLQVDLDTFHEKAGETSTTHVHDDHRLVVIESGSMRFWDCVGPERVLRAGDMLFVPRGRLHGSVVTSGECVYHQPIIKEEHLETLAVSPVA